MICKRNKKDIDNMAILSIVYNPETVVYEIEFDGDDPLQIIAHGCSGEANTNQRHVVSGIIQDLAGPQKSENTVGLLMGDTSYTDKVAFTPEMLNFENSKKAKSFFDKFYVNPHKGLNIPFFLGIGNHDATGYFNRPTQKGTHDYDIAISSTKALCKFVTTGYPTQDAIKINAKKTPKWHLPQAYYGLHFTKVKPDDTKERVLSLPIIDTNHIDRQPEQREWLDNFLKEAYKKSLIALAGHHPLTISSDRRVLKKDERKHYGFTEEEITQDTINDLAYNTSARITRALGEYSGIDFPHLYLYAHHHYAELIDPGLGYLKLIGSGAAAITLGAAEKMLNKLARKPVCSGFPPGLRFNAVGQLATCFLGVFPNKELNITFRGYTVTSHLFRKDEVEAKMLAQYNYSYDAPSNQLVQQADSFKIAPYFFTQHNNGDKLAFIRNMLMLTRLQQWHLLKICLLAYMLEFNKKDSNLPEANRNALIEFIKKHLPTSISTNSETSPSIDELRKFINELTAYLFNRIFCEGVIFNNLIRFCGSIEFCFRLIIRMMEQDNSIDFEKEIPGLSELIESYNISAILTAEKQAIFKSILQISFLALLSIESDKRKEFLLICNFLTEKDIAPDQILKTIMVSDAEFARNILLQLMHYKRAELLNSFSITDENIKDVASKNMIGEEEAIAKLITQKLEKVFPLKFLYDYSENLLIKNPAP